MPDGSWGVNAGGTWSTAANWTSSIIADGAGFTASFNRNITANRTVTLDTNRSIGSLYFQDTTIDAIWTLASSAGISLTLNNGASKPVITSANGTYFTNAWRHIITGRLAGTNGFDAQSNTIVIQNTANTISGTVDVNCSNLCLGDTFYGAGNYAASANVLPSITNYNLVTTSSGMSINTNQNFTFPSTISGSGNIFIRTALAGANAVTFPVGTFSGYSNASATYGLTLYAVNGWTSNVVTNEIPDKVTYLFDGGTSGTNISYLTYNGSSNSTTATIMNLNLSLATTRPSRAILSNTGTGKVVITGDSVNGVAVARISSGVIPSFELFGTNTLNNEISGIVSGGITVVKTDTGRWIFSGVNTYTGATTISQGNFGIANDSALGSVSAAVSLSTGAVMEFSGNITVNKSSSAWTLATGSSLVNLSGDNTITASSITISGTETIDVTSGSLTITNPISGTSARTITKDGTGDLKLTNASTGYLGTIIVNSGTLSAFKMADVGVGSSLGTQALAQATLSMGSNTTLSHIGTSIDSTDRIVTCSAASGSHFTFDSSGNGGAITYSSGGTFTFSTSGTHNLIFSGTNVDINTFDRTIADSSGGGAVSIVKNGSNVWSITSSITATGTITCNDGRLDLGSVNRVFTNSFTVNSGIVSTATGFTLSAPIAMNGGKITSVLATTATLVVNSAATEIAPAALEPDDSVTGNNLITTSPNINGSLELYTPFALDVSTPGTGRVLGTSNTVTVSSTGILKTYGSGSSQNGRARYYNLTLQNGSQMKIGLTI
jgi:autotransporter-associated beta strand protein